LRNRAVLGTAAVLALAAMVVAAWVLHAVYSRPPTGDRTGAAVLFTVEAGESFSSVADRLSDLDLMARPRAIAVYAWLRGWDRRVQAGTYELVRGDRARDVIEKLVTGDVFKVAVTIPEGFRYAQIASALGTAAQVDSAAFGALLADGEVLKRLGVEAPSLEGYLFPDTYLIPWGMKPEDIAGMMRARLDEVLDEKVRRRVEDLGLTINGALTLASIIQAETRFSEELPFVSAVYHNRLRRGMKLEADPTVAYALGGYKDRLYYKDLETDSPFNTYKHNGLPPGPICAPGKAAIDAALHPDTTCEALYFVARGDGRHIFSLTLEDHLKAVKTARRAKSASKSN
jgi:UPF0755 protein